MNVRHLEANFPLEALTHAQQTGLKVWGSCQLLESLVGLPAHAKVQGPGRPDPALVGRGWFTQGWFLVPEVCHKKKTCQPRAGSEETNSGLTMASFGPQEVSQCCGAPVLRLGHAPEVRTGVLAIPTYPGVWAIPRSHSLSPRVASWGS